MVVEGFLLVAKGCFSIMVASPVAKGCFSQLRKGGSSCERVVQVAKGDEIRYNLISKD